MSEQVIEGGESKAQEAPQGAGILTGGDYSKATDWRSGLPEDLKGDPGLGTIESIEGLAKSYVNLQKMIGHDKVIVPGEHATDEDWNKIFSKLGRPEEADKYELQAPETADKDFVKGFKQAAHKAGLLPKQVNELYTWYSDLTSTQMKSISEKIDGERKQQFDSLKNGLGQRYDQFISTAQTAVQEVEKKQGFESLRKWMDSNDLSGDPMMIKLMNFVGQKYMEDTIRSSGRAPGYEHLSTEEIEGKIKDFYKPGSPVLDKRHPKHEQAKQELASLFNMKNSAQRGTL